MSDYKELFRGDMEVLFLHVVGLCLGNYIEIQVLKDYLKEKDSLNFYIYFIKIKNLKKFMKIAKKCFLEKMVESGIFIKASS